MVGGSVAFDLSQCTGEAQIVTINCGGQNFQTFLRTLGRIPKTKLAQWASENGHLRRTGFVFLDRNPVTFAAVLEYYRFCRAGLCPCMLPSECREEAAGRSGDVSRARA